MPSKTEFYRQMADHVATQLTGSWQEWAGFLNTAARLYKYPFHEQLLIYAQRPDATACAEYDLWNEKMGRYVRRGSKGIALVDDSGDKPRLRYVFDITDTGTREHSRTPWLWKLEEQHRDSVSAMLERTYEVGGDDLAQQLEAVAGKLAGEYWNEHRQDFLYIVDDSFLEEYDEFNIEVQFKAAATVSITYALMSRCGLEPERYFDHEDFMAIFDFNTPSTIGALGTAVSQINQQVLRQIGVTIRNAEREAIKERRPQHEESHELHPERRLSDSRPEAERTAGEAPGQVRQDAESIPQGTPSHPIQPAADEREAVPTPAGNRRDRTEPSGAADAPAGERRGRDGAAESQRSDALGGPDEHLQGAGRGDSDGGAYSQLSFFLSENEQIRIIDEAENVKTSSAFSFAQADIDHVLRLGGNTDRQRERIVAAFEKQKSTAEIADTLKNLYHGGNGIGSVTAWYAEDGIHLSHGKTARYDKSAQVISWESAAERIGQLLQEGQFAANVELAEAAGYERSLLAEKLWHLYHDFSDKARDSGYLSCLSGIQRNGFPEETAYGTSRANAYKLLEDSLNLRDVRIYDTVEDADGKERRVLNAKETTLAAQKQQAIRDAFKDWIWKDPERRRTLVRQYNEEMNSTRPREYDGSHIVFGGMNPSITLREHQLNAIAHVMYGGNTLLAHEVGAGKTFEMVAAAMESKRLGLCQKSLFVVPNHLTEQWASEFLRLYPSANILVTTKKDFETHNRKKFCARIATGDYDAIIMGHSQFEKIPISRERQERLLYEQIDEITEGIAEVQASGGERFTVKQLERTRKSLEARLEKLQAESRKDDVVTFEQLGVDRLFVDEAHNYKNLFLYTKMRNVAGLSTSDAQKSSDMFAKCRYMDELTGNRGVIFATGTPVSNSMTELYTMQRYLQYDRLQELNMTHFDCWASRFGETVTALELAPEGTGYRARTRFSKFFNLPELMNLFKEVADIKTADQLNLPTPEVEYHNIVAQPTEHQQEMVKALSERASEVHRGSVDPSVDNMLKITSDGRKLGLDQRIVNQMLPDEPGTKINQCVDNIMQIWRDGDADKLTQLVFCDISTPQAAPSKKAAKQLDNPLLHGLEEAIPLDEPEPAFTIYEDIRQKLIAQGMPADQIAFIHEANTEVRKKELFSKVRTGQVRVLLGSTAKMGAGTNVQDRLVALHDLDCPWRPGDLAQRKGRIERQGNQNPLVHVYRYVTEGTFDAYLWQTVENKQKFISQIMTSKSPVRSCDDVDETALSFAEIKALCAGDPRIKERMDLDVEVAKLKLMKADHQSKQYRLEDQLLKYFPQEIETNKGYIQGFEADLETLAAHPHPADGFAGMEIRGDVLTDKENAGAALLDACKEVKTSDPVQIGSYRGYAMSVEFSAWKQEYTLLLKGQMTHRATLGTDPRGNLTRIDNALAQMPQRLEAVKNQLENLYQQQAAAKEEVGKPFPFEDDLRVKSARLVELDTLLNIDGKGHTQPETVVAKSARPSVLDSLKRPVPPRSLEKKPKQHEEVR